MPNTWTHSSALTLVFGDLKTKQGFVMTVDHFWSCPESGYSWLQTTIFTEDTNLTSPTYSRHLRGQVDVKDIKKDAANAWETRFYGKLEPPLILLDDFTGLAQAQARDIPVIRCALHTDCMCWKEQVVPYSTNLNPPKTPGWHFDPCFAFWFVLSKFPLLWASEQSRLTTLSWAIPPQIQSSSSQLSSAASDLTPNMMGGLHTYPPWGFSLCSLFTSILSLPLELVWAWTLLPRQQAEAAK